MTHESMSPLTNEYIPWQPDLSMPQCRMAASICTVMMHAAARTQHAHACEPCYQFLTDVATRKFTCGQCTGLPHAWQGQECSM